MSDKGRLTVPSDIREAAGLSQGGELIARAAADGTVILETREAIIRRIRDAAPPAPLGGWALGAWDREDAEDDDADDGRWLEGRHDVGRRDDHPADSPSQRTASEGGGPRD